MKDYLYLLKYLYYFWDNIQLQEKYDFIKKHKDSFSNNFFFDLLAHIDIFIDSNNLTIALKLSDIGLFITTFLSKTDFYYRFLNSKKDILEKKFSLKVISIYKELEEYYLKKDKFFELAQLYIDWGIFFINFKSYDKALSFFNLSKDLYNQLEDKLNLVVAKYNIAFLLMEKRDYKTAFVLVNELLTEIKENDKLYDLDIKVGITLLKANLLEYLGRQKDSIEFYEKAEKLYRKLENYNKLLRVKIKLASLYEQFNLKDQAFRHYNELYELTKFLDYYDALSKFYLLYARYLSINLKGERFLLYALDSILFKSFINDFSYIKHLKFLVYKFLISMNLDIDLYSFISGNIDIYNPSSSMRYKYRGFLDSLYYYYRIDGANLYNLNFDYFFSRDILKRFFTRFSKFVLNNEIDNIDFFKLKEEVIAINKRFRS